MNFYKFQKEARKTAIYPQRGTNDGYIYPTLGLAGEAGEVSELVKKTIRDHDNEWSGKRKDQLMGELGDVLWYVANLCSELGLDMDEIAKMNVKKLKSRQKRDVIRGDGSDR